MQKIFIPYSLKRKLDYLVENTSEEFTLFGKSEIVKGGVRLVDVRIPNQTSAGATTELAESDLIDFVEELVNDGENPKEWNFWVHSHNTMGAFWSKTDKDQMESFGAFGVDCFYSVVLSTQGAKGAYSVFKPLFAVNDDIEVETEQPTASDFEPETAKLWKRLIELTQEVEVLEAKLDEQAQIVSPETEQLFAELQIKNKTEPEYKGKFENNFKDDLGMFDTPYSTKYFKPDTLGENEFISGSSVWRWNEKEFCREYVREATRDELETWEMQYY